LENNPIRPTAAERTAKTELTLLSALSNTLLTPSVIAD
jgi:hypothetical protein